MTTPSIEELGRRMERALPTLTSAATSRRGFLVGAGALAGAIVLAACGNDDNDNDTAGDDETSTTVAADKVPAGDLAVAELAAGLEVLAVDTYAAALAAAGAGKLGEVPPAVAEFVKIVKAQHEAHRDAWNKVLTSNGGTAVSAPNAKLKPTIDQNFAKVSTAVGAAQLALELEDIAANTYLDAIGKLQSGDAIALAGSIYPIDMQHSAILLFVLGKYPVPNVFGQTKESAAA